MKINWGEVVYYYWCLVMGGSCFWWKLLEGLR